MLVLKSTLMAKCAPWKLAAVSCSIRGLGEGQHCKSSQQSPSCLPAHSLSVLSVLRQQCLFNTKGDMQDAK